MFTIIYKSKMVIFSDLFSNDSNANGANYINLLIITLDIWGTSIIDKYMELTETAEDNRPKLEPMYIPIIFILIIVILISIIYSSGENNKSDIDKKLDMLLKLRIGWPWRRRRC